ncbi:MAG: Crp/Fnr family transcriptional regulator [Prochlorotrichaceae cyanobacterium]|jgi:CRP-like cAMP-binding protein
MLTSVERLLFVRGVPIFKELRDDFLVRLASIMEELSFPPRHTIFQKGEEGRSLYIVVHGNVRVRMERKEIQRLTVGDAFGEMALFDSEPRSASVTTLDACDCLMLTQQQLYEAIDETPGIAVNIIRLLSRRIRELNDRLNEEQAENLRLTTFLQTPGAAHSLPHLNPPPPATPIQSTL